MQRCRFLLLGSPHIETESGVVHLTLRKAVALLAYLAVQQRAFSREFLATLLWPEQGERPALANLRRILSLLNGELNGCILTEGDHVGLDQSLIRVDVDEFHALTSRPPTGRSLHDLEEASALYRGSFLEGFVLGDCPEFDEWQDTVRARLEFDFESLLEQLSREYLREDRPLEAIPFAFRWLELDQLNEAAHRALMEAYARAGRRGAALKEYESCVDALGREGLEPESATRELHHAIARGQVTRSNELKYGPTPTPERLSSAGSRSGSGRRRFTSVGAALFVVVLVAFVLATQTESPGRSFEVDVAYGGTMRLDRDNPLLIFVGDLTQPGAPEEWGRSLIAGEGRYSISLEEVPRQDNDDSGYFLLVVHDVGNNLQEPYYPDPDDAAALYKEVPGNLVYGGFNPAGGSPVYAGESYSFRFSEPPLPTPDSYEMDDWDVFGTTLDYAALPVRQHHTFHETGSGDVDRDWFRIFVPAGRMITAETFSAGGLWEVDTAIDLCDSEMSYIRSSHDKSWGDNYSKLTYVNDTGKDQLFHFLVKPYNQYRARVFKVGEYILEFRQGE